MPDNLSEKEYRFGKEVYLSACVEKGEAIILHPQKGYFQILLKQNILLDLKWTLIPYFELSSTILVQFETISVSLYV